MPEGVASVPSGSRWSRSSNRVPSGSRRSTRLLPRSVRSSAGASSRRFPVRTAPEHKAPVGFRGPFRRRPSGPVWLAFEAEAPAGSPIWQFREVRRPLVPPGCPTMPATLADARGKPAASAWRRLRQPPSPSASHRPLKGAPFRLGCGVRRFRSEELPALATHVWCHANPSRAKGIPPVHN